MIPFGGSNRDGALAYADAARELRAQLPGRRPRPRSSRSARAAPWPGLVAELGPGHVLGVHAGAVAAPAEAVAALASTITGRAARPARPCACAPTRSAPATASLTEPAAAAIRLAARTEGIVLDPTYTGRAMAGLIAAVRDGDLDRDAPVVFWHTGGLPGLFGHPDDPQRLLSRTDPRRLCDRRRRMDSRPRWPAMASSSAQFRN